jgi:3-deoxy-manno-octulosonate cytidylyltransferase (CMP-KDO synthetase)
MRSLIVIPSRKGSTRLPNKPMIEFGGKTLVRRVWDQAVLTQMDVIVATDSEEIKGHVESFGGTCYMTSPNHRCGTDRVREATGLHGADGYEAIINLQGDLPFIGPGQILESTIPLVHGFDVGTLVCQMEDSEKGNKNCVKAICSKSEGEPILSCHWFLRASLGYGYRHAGIYSFWPEVLETPIAPSEHEAIEDLEQLRFLEGGYSIGACLTQNIPMEINVVEDIVLEEVKKWDENPFRNYSGIFCSGIGGLE